MNNIYQAIAAIMNEVEAIGKNKRNQQQGFAYRGIDDMYNELQPKFAKHKVFIASEVLESSREERQSAKGGLLLWTILKVKFTFFAEDGSNVSSIMIGEAMDSGDKGANKAMSIALKYCLMQLLLIPTEDLKKDDPDGQVHEVQPKQQKAVNGAKNAPDGGEKLILFTLLNTSSLEEGTEDYKKAFNAINSCQDYETYQKLEHRLQDLQKEAVNLSQKDIAKKVNKSVNHVNS